MSMDVGMGNIEQLVYDALLQHGYPDDSIVIEGKIDKRRYADFLIKDLATGLPVMMIAVKAGSERTVDPVKKLSFDSLKRNYSEYNAPIKTIAAIYHKAEERLEFVDFTQAIKEDAYNRRVDDYSLPPYNILIIGAKQKVVQKQEEQNKKSIAVLRWLCWGIWPFVGLVLILLDAFDVYSFSTLRLIVIGVCVGITLIPCFKQITIGELSLKNAIDQEHDEK